ncbi:thioester-containing protein 1 allele S3-like [Wyeomyia smithii]|uniref:thioester-containing protein 1 allele S3-like n=1 Tax=Wyeomyia smithii TaxID=174621 RepID=UPI002467D59E|nr:thioester-containing protein 1 allele S3-like [Wyeomyia smithii]
MRLLQILLCCGLLATLCECQGLSVIGPKFIRPNSVYNIAFSNALSTNIQLRLELEGSSEDITVFNATNQIKLERKTGRYVGFQVGAIPDGIYRLSIQSLQPSFGFSESIELLYDGKTSSLFIQTDKPVYKPGDVLRFRVIAIDADTRPVTDYKTVDIELTDKDENSIRHWKYARLNNGIFESAVQLASSPVLGNWNLAVRAANMTVVKQIEVREYVLPKFFVKAYPSEILLIENKKVSVTVEAKYTFGDPVDGTARVDLYFEGDEMLKPDMSITQHISGVTTVSFALGNALEVEMDAVQKNVYLKVEVKETFTNRTVSIVEEIPVYEYPYRFSLIKSLPRFRPGLPFSLDLSITDHNGEHAPEETNAEIQINYEGEGLENEVSTQGTIHKGLVSFVIEPPESADRVEIKVKYHTNNYVLVDSIDGAQSKSRQYLQIALKAKQKIRANTLATFEISCTESLSYFSYTVISRGNVVVSGHELVRNRKRTDFRLKLTSQMAPKARIIVSYMKKFLIYDDLELNFETFNNDFSFTLDTEQYIPGQNFYVDVKGAKDSYIAFAAIDQSALLLGRSGHDITEKDVLNELALYGSTEPNEFDPFNTMGLFLRTTAELDIPYPRNQFNRISGTAIIRKHVQKAIHIRTEFPEAWLWKNYTMDGRHDRFSFNDTVPDTITSWTVSGFALSPTLGLGIIKQPQTFVVKQPFYIVLNLPYSIKRDEVTLIQVTIFNFLGNSLTTDVTLFNKNEEIEFVEKASNDTTSRSKAVLVPTSTGKPISFMIKAKKLGEIAIKVEAINLLASDAAEHMLRVTPESRRYEKNEARFIERDDRGLSNFPISINIPKDIDEGSAKIKFTLDADLFGTTISNLESLIRQPSGCGEQNMVNFVPNIVVLDYLSETGKVAEEVRTKAINFLQSGYQNQLKYKRADGSFSVWGGSDSKGSTFLTAFVAKSFKIADKYMAVDKKIVEDAFHWLAGIQTPEGRFDEVGRVIHADMQGGLRSTNYALTAYVLIAFLENQDIANTHQRVVSNSIRYLESNLYSITDAYDLALVSYALTLGNSPKRKNALDKLLEISIFDKDFVERYWNRHPVKVEIAGYALLTFVANKNYPDGASIMRWLNRNRFALGGYPGTQDTFVGLKALTKFAAKTSAHRNDYRVKIHHPPNKFHTFDIDKKKSMVIQELDLPNYIRNLDVKIEGIGNGFFQVAYEYYQNIQQTKPSFKLDVEMLNTTTYHVQHLQICVKYVPKEAYVNSNMALVEVFFPSGLVAEEDAVEDLSGEIRKTELRFAATSIVIYYDYLGPETNCFKVTSYRKYKVAMHRPAYVVVYDYYDQDRFAIQLYEGKVMQLCDICEDEDCLTLSC